MKPYYEDESVTLYHGDCIEVMRTLPDNSVDSIVTDPPYGLGFMGRAWDALPPGLEWAEECLRVLKPGGYILAFGGTRTWHRLAVAIEDGGFEIRDSYAWIYSQGFPKSHNVGKSAGTEWEGWGTALKPAFEPVVAGRKPLVGTVAVNVLTHGTGALNIDASRIGSGDNLARPNSGKFDQWRTAEGRVDRPAGADSPGNAAGRFPANVILDESQAEALDQQSGTLKSGVLAAHHARNPKESGILGAYGSAEGERGYGDTGGASRFFYCAKAPKSERPVVDGVAHETVKPLALMRYLAKMVTRPGGTVLDTFTGSGTTAEACILEGFKFIGAEKTARYLPLIDVRIQRANSTQLAAQQAWCEVPLDLFGASA